MLRIRPRGTRSARGKSCQLDSEPNQALGVCLCEHCQLHQSPMLVETHLLHRSRSRPSTACSPLPLKSSLLPRVSLLSPIGYPSLLLRIACPSRASWRCMFLSASASHTTSMPRSLARFCALHTGVAVGSARAGRPGAIGGACGQEGPKVCDGKRRGRRGREGGSWGAA